MWCMVSISEFCREFVALAQLTCRTMHGFEDLVHFGRLEANGEADPSTVHDGRVHCLSRGVTHAFVEPHDVADGLWS